MSRKHYAIWITEDTLRLIKFVNGGVLPAGIEDEKLQFEYFCFSIDSEGKIAVLKNPFRTFDSLWRDSHHVLNDRTLLSG